jgi:hypothetical protein
VGRLTAGRIFGFMRPIALWVMLWGLVCGSAWAMNGDMGASTQPLTDGSADYPYLIEDVNDFDVFAGNSAYWAEDVHTKLMTDIDLSGRTYTTAVIAPDYPDTSTWNFDGSPFEGVFEGNDFIIRNLNINTLDQRSDYLGLFGHIEGEGAEVKNLGIDNINISGGGGSENIGGLCGANYNTNILNCHATGFVTGSVSVGVLCGRNNRGHITNCSSAGTVSGTENIGGLLGINHNGGIPTNCYSTCSVSGGTMIGGLVGNNLQTTIVNCYSTGSVSGSDRIGGLCGENSGNLTNCNSLCSVIGDSFVGGLVGWNYGTINSCYASGSIINDCDGYFLGGLCGINHRDIVDCYATGSVTGGESSIALGGLCGGNYDSVINCYSTGAVTTGANSTLIGGLCGGQDVEPYFSNSFWDVEQSGIGNPGDDYYGATGKTTAEMMAQSTFADWDFTTPDWMTLREGEDTPRLAWQEIYRGDIAGLYGADLVDFAYLGRFWGADCETDDCGRADIDGSGMVDLPDLAAVADDWLR